MGPQINTHRLALVLNILPSSEITKFNGASLHQSSKGCPTHLPCNRRTVEIEVNFQNNLFISIVCLSFYHQVPGVPVLNPCSPVSIYWMAAGVPGVPATYADKAICHQNPEEPTAPDKAICHPKAPKNQQPQTKQGLSLHRQERYHSSVIHHII